MTEFDYNKHLKKKFQKEVKDTFNDILAQKFTTIDTDKEVIEFDKIKTAFHNLNYLCDFCEFDKETKSFITLLYTELKHYYYFIPLGIGKVKVVDAEFVDTTMEKYWWKIYSSLEVY